MNAFRPARPSGPAWNLAKTAAQAAVFWGAFILAGPLLLVALERRLGVPPLAFAGQHTLAVVVGVITGALNLTSGALMAIVGRGTPFPLDTARQLVVRGPYRHVRNPMAIGGLGVGAAVGLWLGSITTLAYVVAGGLLWQLVARPLEERDLEARFGSPYARYRDAVRCWWPRARPWRDDDTPPSSRA